MRFARRATATSPDAFKLDVVYQRQLIHAMLQRYILGCLDVNTAKPVLSICMTCRDGREDEVGRRGGARLAGRVAAKYKDQIGFDIRGVNCMSQCKRSCTVSMAGEGCFTYVFGDLDPENDRHIEALFELMSLYSQAPEGFLERRERPTELQAGILGRLPPLGSQSSLISDLKMVET